MALSPPRITDRNPGSASRFPLPIWEREVFGNGNVCIHLGFCVPRTLGSRPAHKVRKPRFLLTFPDSQRSLPKGRSASREARSTDSEKKLRLEKASRLSAFCVDQGKAA